MPRTSFYRRAVFSALEDMPLGRLHLRLPAGDNLIFGARTDAAFDPLPLNIPGTATITVQREAFFKKCVLAGDIGFAEAYLDGDWTTPNLTAVIAWFIQNHEHAPELSGSKRAQAGMFNLLRWFNRLGHLLRPNNRATARRNISEHYDLSNDFLDRKSVV